MTNFRLLIMAVIMLCGMLAPAAQAARASVISQTKPAGPLTLDQCISIALMQHPKTTVAQQRVAEAQERLAMRKGVKLPQLGFRTEAQRYDSLPGNKANIIGGGNTDVYSAVTLSTLLFSSGRAEADIDSASASMYATVEDMRRTRQDIAFSVARAYYNVLRAETILAARTEAVAQMEQHLKIAQEKFNVGKAAKLDVLRAEVQLADVTQARLLAANQLDIAGLELANSMGVDPDLYQTVPAKDDTPAASFSDAGEFVTEALKAHPDYLKSALLVRSAESSVRSAKGESGPELGIIGSYNREGKDIPDIQNWNVGFAVTMPIYTGGVTRAKVGQARAVVEQSKANGDLSKQNITLAVRSAVLSTQDAANRLQATSKSIEQASEALRVAQEKYNAGLGSSTEVIDTQVALTQAETNYANALYDGKIALAQLSYAVGRDPEFTDAESTTGGTEK